MAIMKMGKVIIPEKLKGEIKRKVALLNSVVHTSNLLEDDSGYKLACLYAQQISDLLDDHSIIIDDIDDDEIKNTDD